MSNLAQVFEHLELISPICLTLNGPSFHISILKKKISSLGIQIRLHLVRIQKHYAFLISIKYIRRTLLINSN